MFKRSTQQQKVWKTYNHGKNCCVVSTTLLQTTTHNVTYKLPLSGSITREKWVIARDLLGATGNITHSANYHST